MDFKRVFLAEVPSYSILFLPASVIFLVYTIITAIKIKAKRSTIILFLLGSIGLLLAPFYMTFLTGFCQLLRSQLVYPFILAFVLAVILYNITLRIKKPSSILAIVLAVVISVHGLLVSNQYQQLTHFAYEWDNDKVMEFYSKAIDYPDNAEPTMVFIGTMEPSLPEGYIGRWEATGVSYFNTANNSDTSFRISRLLLSKGYKNRYPEEFEYEKALAISKDMPTYPNEGYMQLIDGLTIIKLGEQ